MGNPGRAVAAVVPAATTALGMVSRPGRWPPNQRETAAGGRRGSGCLSPAGRTREMAPIAIGP
ncbi:hypothetical protein ACNPQM_41815 [Streptomyces sp. NPDC056231]|uniref:hypothetical protein n=1 Tax=Streptomyces sp. NPDC056231 TaxID=3345755 RepID=UPI003AAC0EB6